MTGPVIINWTILEFDEVLKEEQPKILCYGD